VAAGERLNAADVAVAVAWRFCQYYNATEIPASRYPALVAYSARAEALPEFAAVRGLGNRRATAGVRRHHYP
jgi:glutathione S-transferase